MSVERVTRIVSTSPDGFEDAIRDGLNRAKRTLRNLRRLEVVSHAARLDVTGEINEYEVTLDITFVLE